MTVRAEIETTLMRVDDGYSPTATVNKSGSTATIAITDKNGTTTATVADGDDGVSVTSVVTQYYLSTSSSTAPDPSSQGWSEEPQTFISGRFYWTRAKATYSNGAISYSDPIYNKGLTQANELAIQAKTSADGKNAIYYGTSAPAGGTHKTGDTWFNSSEDNAIYTWNGTTWAKEELGADAIADLSITNAKIANSTIQNGKIANLDAGKITSGDIDANRIKTNVVSAINATVDKIDAKNINVDGTLIVGSSDVDTAINNAKQIKTNSASGSIATFTGSKYPAVEVVADIDPIQDLNGYDAPWVGGAGKNLLNVTASTTTVNGVTFTVNSDGSITVSGTTTASNTFLNLNYVNSTTLSIPEGTWKTTLGVSASGNVRLQTIASSALVDTNAGLSFKTATIPSGATNSWCRLQIQNSGVTVNETVYPMICASTETDTIFAPYENICQISGHDEAVVSVVGKNLLENNVTSQTVTGTFTITRNSDGSLTLNGTSTETMILIGNLATNVVGAPNAQNDGKKHIPNGTWRVSTHNSNAKIRLQIIGSNNPSGISNLYNYGVVTDSNVTIDDSYAYNWVRLNIQSGTFSNETIYPTIAPTSDYSYEPYIGQSYTTPLGRTVYGGTLDVVSGELTVDKLLKLSSEFAKSNISSISNNGTLTRFWLYSGASTLKTHGQMWCSAFPFIGTQKGTDWGNYAMGVYDDPTTAGTYPQSLGIIAPTELVGTTQDSIYSWLQSESIQFVWTLATPQTYQLTPTQVQLLQGTNNLWTDSGDVNVTYAIISADAVEALNNPIDGASKVATNYITAIDESGITIHADSNTSSNYTKIDADGMEVFKGGDSVALYGEGARIGGENSSKVELGADKIAMYSVDGASALEITPSGNSKTQNVSIIAKYNISYKSGTITLPTMPTNGITVSIVVLKNGSGRTEVQRPFSFVVGTAKTETINFTYYPYLKNNSGATSMSVTFTYTPSGNTLSYTCSVAKPLYIENFVYVETIDTPLAVFGGDVVIGGHKDVSGTNYSPVGTVLGGNFSKSLADSLTLVDLAYNQTIPAGTWVINWSIRFPQNNTGKRATQMYANGSGVGSGYIATTATQDGETALCSSSVYSSESNFLLSFSARQNSGSAMTVTVYWDAVRIA